MFTTLRAVAARLQTVVQALSTRFGSTGTPIEADGRWRFETNRLTQLVWEGYGQRVIVEYRGGSWNVYGEHAGAPQPRRYPLAYHQNRRRALESAESYMNEAAHQHTPADVTPDVTVTDQEATSLQQGGEHP